MKLTCDKTTLLGALTAASKAVSTRTAIPALECIHLAVDNGRLTATGFDLHVGVRAEADVSGDGGATLINAKLLLDIVKKCSNEVTITVTGAVTTITSGTGKFTVACLPAADFPALPEVEDATSLTMPQSIIKSMLAATLYATSTNDTRPIQTGALFELKDGRLVIATVDGFRLAVCRSEVESTETIKCVIPAAALREVEKLTGNEAKICIGDKHATFSVGSITLITRLLDGEFLKYESAIPLESKYGVVVNAKDFLAAVERVAIMANETIRQPLRCVFGDEVISLSCNASLGRATDSVESTANGGEIEMGFNARYLQDALRAVPDEMILVSVTSPVSPCVITPMEGDAYTAMVLPVRLQS